MDSKHWMEFHLKEATKELVNAEKAMIEARKCGDKITDKVWTLEHASQTGRITMLFDLSLHISAKFHSQLVDLYSTTLHEQRQK